MFQMVGTMRTGHLFAGAGGGLYADLILGHKPVFAVEWDGYAARTLEQRAKDGWFPGLHVHHGDVQLFDPSEWKGRVDSIHAGFPCQDISVAGNGEGIEGERSGLWKEVKRIASDLQPEELYLENSPAITSRGLDVVLGDLAKLGYDARWCVLPASAVGAPHIRARWWCLARLTNTNKSYRRQRSTEQPKGNKFNSFCEGTLGDTNGSRKLQQEGFEQEQRRWHSDSSAKVPDSKSQRQERAPDRTREAGGRWAKSADWWSVEPGVGRVVDGLANRGNRIKCLGNGQVPLQAAVAYKLLDAGFGT